MTTYKLTDNNGVSHFIQANTVEDAIHKVCHLFPNQPGEIVRAEAVKVFGVSTGEQGYGAGDIFEGTEYRESPDGIYQVKEKKLNPDWVDVFTVFTIINNNPETVL